MPYTYDTLVADVIANMEEDSDEFVSALPSIVERAQDYLQKRIDSSQLNRLTSVSISASTREFILPSDLLVLRSIQIRGSSGWTNMIPQNNEYLTAYWPDYTSVGMPEYYATIDNQTLLLAPTPVSNLPATIEYIAKVTVLTSGAPSNWFSQNVGAAFFAATMMYANMWTKNSEAVQIWRTTADEELTVINNEARRQRRSDTIDKSAGSPENTLGGDV